MPYVRKYRKGARKPKMPYKRRSVLRNKPSRTFVKKVQKIIHKNNESKEASYSFPITVFNSVVNNVADVCRVIPTVQTGVLNSQRIGDQIKGQRLTIKGHMMVNAVPNTTGVTIPTAIPANTRFMIRAFVCSVKKFNSFDDVSVTTAWMSKFLKNGTGVQALDGTVQSMYLPVNTDVITVHKEIKKYISIPAIYAQTATAAGFSNTVVGFENSCKFFNLNISMKKLLKYDESSFTPQNSGIFFCLSYCHLDDSSPDLITSKISCAYVSTLTYEDA